MAVVLIIDDDRDICQTLSRFLSKNNFQVEVAYNGEAGLDIIREKDIDLVLCDYRLPDTTGVLLLQKIKVLRSVPVIIITGYSDIQTAVQTFKHGASDYVTKPLYPDELLVTIRETLSGGKGGRKGATQNDSTSDQEANSPEFIIGESTQSKKIQEYISLVAPADISLVIIGETGTGKEYVAKSVHEKSKRSGKIFLAIDCGALPKELAGSELFGHMKGSFTGAIADKKGSFELADGGTLFLDEIGNLSYENQVKLLRVLQERKIKRIGGTKEIGVDVRIISATSDDLMKSVKEGTFREDLYHRINEFKIELSPLRERSDDIMVFAHHFLKKANSSLNKSVKGFSEPVTERLKSYFWHGNLRELNNVVKRAVLLTTSDEIQSEALPTEILHYSPKDGEGISESSSGSSPGILKAAAGSAERQAIIDALEKVNYNKTKAAELLKIDRKTLYNKLKLYDIKA